jgi:hypothetical protein
MFLTADGATHDNFLQAARSGQGPIELDPVALASMLSFQYVVDGRSLITGVRRRSWLERVVGSEGEPGPALRAAYGRRVMSSSAAAAGLLRHLRAELVEAFAGFDRVTVLLSGGLDSRLAAAV